VPTLTIDNTTVVNAITGVALSATVHNGAALSLTVSGRPGYAVMYVSGPPGVVSGIWPIIYDPYTKYISFDTAILSGSVAGVAAVNGQTGSVNIYGTGSNIFVTADNGRVYISGSGLATEDALNSLSGALSAQIGLTGSDLYNLITGLSGAISGGGVGDVTQAELNATGAKITALSGYVDTQISGLSGLLEQTGSQAWNAAQNNALNLSGAIQQSGSDLYALTTGASGYLSSLINSTSGGVTSLNGLSGTLTLQGAGNVGVTANGQTLIVSGDTGDYASFALRSELTQTGVLLGGQISSLSGFTTGVSGALQTQINALSSATGLAATGSVLYQLITGLSGQSVIDYATKVQLTQTGVDLLARDLYISGLLATGIAQTGTAAITQANTIGQIISGNLTQTGSVLNGRINSLSGFVGNVSGGLEIRIVETGNAAVAHANGIGQILSGQLALTGQTLLGVIVSTGESAVLHANGIGVNLSGNLSQTGATLGALIIASGNAAVGQANSICQTISGNLTLTGQTLFNRDAAISGGLEARITATGNAAVAHANSIGQTISGNLTLTGQTLQGRINSLSGFVTGVSGGLETRITATGNAAVAHANGIGINLSGNLAQTGTTLFTQTTGLSGFMINLIEAASAGVSAINGLSGVLIIEGTGSISVFTVGSTILISGDSDPTFYATVPFVTGVSGALQTQVNTLTVNLAQTGSVLDNKINSLSGFVGNVSGGISADIVATGSAAVIHANGIGSGLSGNLTLTGQTLQGRIDSLSGFVGNVSGGLETRITATGNAAIAFASGVGFILSGNLTQTGATLQGRITSLSGFVGNVSGGLETRITATGNAAVAHANGIGSIISGNLTLTGQTLQGRITSLSGFVGNVSGGLEVRIAQTGSAAVVHANGIGTIISGNLTQTGILLGQQIAALSGFATGTNGGVISYLTGLLPTGLDTYYIWHPVVFPTIPRISVTFELSGAANGVYGIAISGRSTTGFYALLTDTVDTSGVFLDVVVKT